MTKKGFTLIELLTVIVVLAVLLAITVPSVRTYISNSYAQSYKLDLKAMEEAAKAYVIDEKIKFEEVERKIILINTLVEAGFLDPVIDPQSKEQCEGYVIVDRNYRKYTYKAYLRCGTNYVSDRYGYTDNVFPEIFILGDNPVTIEAGDNYVDAGATATDNIDGNITGNILTTGEVNPNEIGTYTITYSVTDSSDNTTTKDRIINVVDTTAPNIAFGTNGNSTWAKTRSTTVTVSDIGGVNTSSLKYLWNTSTSTPSEGSFSTTFTSGGTINSPAGVTGGYYLWILAKDTEGNTTITRTNAFNLDNTAPTITVSGSNPVYTPLGGTYTDAGATANDTHSGVGNVVPTGTVSVNTAGTYTITYNVSDNAGNAATPATRTVYVFDYIPIYNQTQLAKVCSGNTVSINGYNYTMNASSKYKLMNNITLTGSWAPLCSSTTPFAGTFDGDGRSISGLSITDTSSSTHLGLFTYNTGTIKNLSVAGTITQSLSTSTNNYIGLLVGYNTATINNCNSSGTITASASSTSQRKYTGGLNGYNYGGNITSSSSSVDVSIANGYKYAGGLVGYNTGTISGSHVTGDAVATDSLGYAWVGGIAGYSNGTITNSDATNSTVSAITGYDNNSHAGGLVGSNEGTIHASYSNSTIYSNANGYAHAGGLIGIQYAGTVTNSYATGSVTASQTGTLGTVIFAGGIVGRMSGGTIKNCYASGNVSSTAYYTVYAGGIVGLLESANIYNSYARGNVYGNATFIPTMYNGPSAYVGGFSGPMGNPGTNTNIYNSYATGNVEGLAYNSGLVWIGGFMPTNNSGNVYYSFWNTSATLKKHTTSVSVACQSCGNALYLFGITAAQFAGASALFNGYGDVNYTDILPALNAYVTANSGLGLTSWARNPSINNGYPYLVGVTPTS